MNRGKYKTKQTELIIDYLHLNSELHLSIEDVYLGMNREVSYTTIYRTLEKLVAEKRVIKCELSKKLGSYYQYHQTSHHHLYCTKCNNIIDVDCSIIDELFNHLENEHKFYINNGNNIIHGICDNCYSGIKHKQISGGNKND